MTTRTADCDNCGASAPGAYCSACGQPQGERMLTVAAWLRQFAGDHLSLDAKLPRTLLLLLRRPGALTAEWYAGRRQRYVSPSQLYMLVLAGSLAVMFGLGPVLTALGTGSAVRETVEPFRLAQQAEMEAITAWLREVLTVVAVLAPLTLAGALRLVQGRRTRFFIPHLVLALHQSGVLLVLATVGFSAWRVASHLVDVPAWAVGIGSLTVLAAAAAHLAAAVARVYPERLLTGAPRFAAAAALSLTVLAGGSAAVLASTTDRTLSAWRRGAAADHLHAARLAAYLRQAEREGDTAAVRVLRPRAARAYALLQHPTAQERYALAVLRDAAGQPDSARIAVTRALELDPEHLLALGLAARLAGAEGDSAAAASYRARLLTAYRRGPAAAEARYRQSGDPLAAYLREAGDGAEP